MEGRYNERVLGLRVWGAYIWRGLFSEFYGILNSRQERSNGLLSQARFLPCLRYLWACVLKKARVSHLEIKVPYNVLLGDTTNGNNVSAKNGAVARLNLLGGEGGNHERRRRERPGAC